MSKCKVISIANQKESVGKITTDFKLGIGKKSGKEVSKNK